MSEQHPLQPPEADRPPQPLRPGSPVRAVTVALVLDLGGSLVLNLLLTVLYAAWLQARGLSGDEIDEAMRHIPPDSWAAIAGVMLGACLDVLSGFVCARIVQRDEWRVGGVLAGLSGLCTLLFNDAGDAAQDLTVLLSLCTVACTLLGVKYGRELNRRIKSAVPSS
jgi:ABC-type Fe3+ transport system permease subunit